LPLMNFRFFEYAGELENAVMILHGEKAHSRYFGEDTFKLLRGDNKELLIVDGASHCDLYDNLDKIPMDRIAQFYGKWMPAE
ncbi:MAG: alpha/beta hydrolase, partial [Duncaniella sp.]|nr:alpha/beta hydrolase [Duncaniella sp.]